MHGSAVDQLITPVKTAILDNHRDLVFPTRQTKLGLLVIIDNQTACQTVVDLTGCRLMRMGMINVEAGAIEDLEFVNPCLAIADHMVGMPVHIGGHVQAVPMGDTRLGELVVEIDTNLLPLLQPDDRAQIASGQFCQYSAGTIDQFRRIAIDLRGLAGQYRKIVHLSQQIQFHIRLEVGIGPVRAATHFHGAQP